MRRQSGHVAAAALAACLLTVSSAGAQNQPDSSLSAGTAVPPLAFSQPDPAFAPGLAVDNGNAFVNMPSANMPFDGRWLDNLGPLPSQASSWDSSAALGYAHAPATGSFALPTSLPAESGVNYTLSPFSGYLNLGSGTGSQAAGGTSGSIAFPIGHSFGLLTDFTAASIGGYGFYQGGSNLYWRDPGLGLIGATGQVGHFGNFGGATFGSGGANFEGYFGRWTPFATVGAFGAQGLATAGYGTIGAAYYPTDNLQFALSGYDYGGFSGVQGGVEYLLPKPSGTAVATTVSVDGFVGNHGTSGAMARLKFLLGPKPDNNKTLIERRRQDDPVTMADAVSRFLGSDMGIDYTHGYDYKPPKPIINFPPACFPSNHVCSANSQCCSHACGSCPVFLMLGAPCCI
jgi:hypothetical protein